MTFTNNWDESQPDGASVDASDLDLWDRNIQKNIRERLEAFLGITDFVTQTTTASSNLKGIKLDMRGSATPSILPGATSFAIRNNADSQNNLLIADNGDVTVRNVLNAASANITGNVSVGGQGYSPLHDAGNSGTAVTFDFNNSNVQLSTLTGNATITLSNPQVGASYLIKLKQDGIGSRTVTWPATVKWSGGITPTLTTTAGRTDIFCLTWNGTNYEAAVFGLNHNS